MSEQTSALYSLICNECESVSKILLERQRREGLSILNPTRVFAKVGAEEQIGVMLDLKIAQVINDAIDNPEEAELELMRLLLLKRVARKVKEVEMGGLPNVPMKFF